MGTSSSSYQERIYPQILKLATSKVAVEVENSESARDTIISREIYLVYIVINLLKCPKKTISHGISLHFCLEENLSFL